MIKSCNGTVEVNGPDYIIQAELTSVIHQLYTEKKLTKEQIQDVFDTAFMSEEELDESINKHLEEIGMTRKKAEMRILLNSIFGDML